jgi:hypothetical protein
VNANLARLRPGQVCVSSHAVPEHRISKHAKYRTGAAEAGNYENLIEVIDELVAREGAR